MKTEEKEISFYEKNIEKQEEHAKHMISITTSSITILLLIVNGIWIFLQEATTNSTFNLVLTIYLILPFIAFILTISFYINVARPKTAEYIEDKGKRLESLKSINEGKNSKLDTARISYIASLIFIIIDMALVSIALGTS